MNLYAERDHRKLGEYYIRHVEAMTAEGLHDKSAIAAELAVRDQTIDILKELMNSMANVVDVLGKPYGWQRKEASHD